MATWIHWFSTWRKKFRASVNFHTQFSHMTENMVFHHFLTPLLFFLSLFSFLSSYMNCCLGTLNSLLSIMKSIPQFFPQSLVPNPSWSLTEARVLYLMLPSLLRGWWGLELEKIIYCSNFAPGSFKPFLFYFSFEGKSSSWFSGSTTCCRPCPGDLLAAGKASLVQSQSFSIPTWMICSKA